MKGENLLYNKVVSTSLGNVDYGSKSQRANSLKKRSDAIACRYYYHSVLCRLRYDDCLLHLHHEFFLEPDTIIGYIKKRLGYVNSLAAKRATIADLRRLYPFFDWSVKAPYLPDNQKVKFTSAGSTKNF